MLFLACIPVIPFTTSMIDAYSRFFIAEVLFGINIFLTILSFLIMYLYTYNKGFLENKPSKSEKKVCYKNIHHPYGPYHYGKSFGLQFIRRFYVSVPVGSSNFHNS